MNDIPLSLQSAWDAGDMDTARALVREELKANPSADIYYWAARLALDDRQRIGFLQKAIEVDPFHSGAHTWLRNLQPAEKDLPAPQDRNLVHQPAQPPPQSAPFQQQINIGVSQSQPVVVVVNTKSRTVAFLLTFFFGPLGMFYSTISGAFIMLVVSFILALATGGVSLLLTWPVSIIWGVAAAGSKTQVRT